MDTEIRHIDIATLKAELERASNLTEEQAREMVRALSRQIAAETQRLRAETRAVRNFAEGYYERQRLREAARQRPGDSPMNREQRRALTRKARKRGH